MANVKTGDIERIKGNIKSMVDQGAPEADIDAYLGHEGVSLSDLQAPTTTITPPKSKYGTEETVPEWGMKNPNLYGVAGAARETLGPIAEALGLAGGAIAGAPAGLLGGVAGAGLGYAGARQGVSSIDELLGNKAPSGLLAAGKQATSDVGMGSTMEAGGQLTGKALEAAIKYAPRLYESALKPSTTLKQATRMKRVGTALEEGIPVSKSGLEKSKEIALDINNEIKTRLKNFSEESISRDAALQPVEQLKGKVISKSINPKDDLATITKYIEDIQGQPVSNVGPVPGIPLTGGAQPEQIPILQAQAFKQTLNKELDQYYKLLNQGKIVPATALAQTKAAMADGLRAEITKVFPEIKSLNAREASLIELNKSLERAVNRISNRELIPLLTGIAFSGKSPYSLTKAIALKIVEHPEVKSKLAIAFHRAIPVMAEATTKAIGVSVAPEVPRGGEVANPESDEINQRIGEWQKASPEKKDLMRKDMRKYIRSQWNNMSTDQQNAWENSNSEPEK